MRSHGQSRFSGLQLTPLAACIAAIFTLAAPAALAGTVTNCMDAGPGSLRAVVGAAVEGETIDMTGLLCSTISLQTGAITILQNNLNLNGPGANNLSISGKYVTTIENDRIFTHQGTGILHVQNLSIVYGSLSSSSVNTYGGCIYSKGSVILSHVNVYVCSAHATGHVARGGAIFTADALTAIYSNIVQNDANGGFGQGGGAFVGGNFSAKYSTIGNNTATGGYSPYITTASGGGLYLGGSVTITGSTISGNHSFNREGGIHIASTAPASHSAVITNSTISGNSAFRIGGMSSNIATTLQNSTIAFNTATSASPLSPGLVFNNLGGSSIAVNLQSSLLSNNTQDMSENDLSTIVGAGTSITISGANNLVRKSSVTLPPGTIELSCPVLGALRNNGGTTLTHALSSRSPAIDAGNNNAINPLSGLPFAYDQRRSPYVRVSGAFADIGAYEVDQVDVIFNSSFEGCVP